MAYVKRERSKEAIKRSAKKVARKKRLKRKEEAFIELDASGNRPTLASKPKQRITKDMYLRELAKIPHASEYTLLSDFKLYTPKCIVQYKHNVCKTKFQAKPRDFELKKSLCPKCYKDMSSTTIESVEIQ
jgi:hypothetical protein